MTEKDNPIRSLTGSTRDGAPLGASRLVTPDLAPWFYWISVAEGELAPDQTVRCGMLSDHACIRLLFGGTWTAQTASGPMIFEPGEKGLSLYFGPQTRIMPISVTGSYRVITLQFTAGAVPEMGGPDPSALLDRIVDYDAMVGHGRLCSHIPVGESYDRWNEALEAELRRFIGKVKPAPPNPVVVAFERQSLARPDFLVADFAAGQGVSKRTVERVVKRAYGLSPKQVLRRARALDTAARLLGVALPEEEAAMELRYFDQSHRTREIRQFFGMTPGELERGPHPMLRLNIELRQTRRLRSLSEIGERDQPPWRDPASEPGAEREAGTADAA